MARATRSSAQQEKDKPPEPAPSPRKPAAKKRKRTSLSDGSDLPALKQQRTEDDIKDDLASQEPEDPAAAETQPSSSQLPSSGDVPIQSQYAGKILDILEIVDTQGLLDRVFPLPTEHEDTSSASSSAGPSSSTRMYSFRMLLREPELFPLRVLRSAVQHLFPISSHPRSRPSATAAEQSRFCNLALSLLDQASLHSAPFSVDVESILADTTSEEPSKEPAARRRKYALVQKMASGDWWSSVNTTAPPVSEDGKELTDLPTGHAALAVILPTASAANQNHGITLASYARKRTGPMDSIESRQVTSGRFLDYGPYASFAPTFDQTCTEVGRMALGEVLFQKEKKRRLKALQDRVRAKQMLSQKAGQPSGSVDPDVQMVDGPSRVGASTSEDALEGLLSPEQVASIKATLGSLEQEAAVDELITRNARALERLEELQKERLLSGAGAVQETSDEWETAQNILNSLAVLASLRPRTSGDESGHPPLIPTATALQKLHRTLPVGDTGGWTGTLPPARANALRDDTTVRMKAGTSPTLTASVAAAPPVTPAPPKLSTPSTSQQSSYYQSYAQTQTPQYRGNYGTYATTQPPSTQYYQYPSTTQQPITPAAHYPNSQYQATGHQQYYQGGWYNYQGPPAQGSTGGTSSGRATPQPAVATATSTAAQSAYTFYNNTPQQQQRAVANTVLSAATSKQQPYQQGSWPNGATSAAPTLPPHLRGSGGTPGTPGVGGYAAAAAYPAYYQNAQATPLR
ncbi:hypothetical protein EIP91_009676 [Steccherinum ochraceum]|uniref:Uncharacterized protein n=1 Tax=Steccherinum ochraceum TaxID=92696 RepID=A0A4R0RTB5_9APHY|nr:hypothetical protein EIP91_009676 [Steccherinum ochraceum]